MLSRLFSRRNRAISQQSKSIDMEGLETRRLFALPIITGVLADNRGEVTVQFNHSVGGLSTNTVHFYVAGPDGKIGTKDDVGLLAPVDYSPSRARLIIHGLVKADKGYRVRIDSLKVKDKAKLALDGEFTGSLPTGNGVQGGNFAFVVRNDKSQTPIARMYTNLGFIDLKLRKDVAPLTVANFLDYANTGRYDNTFFARSVNSPSPFVIQGGGLQITGKGTTAASVKATKQDAPVADENPGGISNTIGTLAFAKAVADGNTNQFFINLADNSFLDPASNTGGFTVFAQIVKNLTIAQAINQKPTTDLTSQIGAEAQKANAGVDQCPVNNAALAQAGLNPVRDLEVVRRIAVIDKIAPLA